MDSTRLIDLLSTELPPVRRLRPPEVRALGWLSVTGLFLGLIIWTNGLRPDFDRMAAQPRFLGETAAILLTGITAALAAFKLSVPGTAPALRYLPLLPLTGWLLLIGKGCLDDANAGTLYWGISTHCLQQICWTGLVSGVPMLLMLRRAAPFERLPLALLAGLASASLAAFAMSLYHSYDTSLIVLLSHGLIMALLTLGFGLVGPAVLRHRLPRA